MSAETNEKRHAIVTGGGSGIGAAIAVAFAEAGIPTAILGRDGAKLEAVAAGRESITPQPCDVGDRKALAETYRAIVSEFGRVDIAVNCAGTNTPKRMMADVAAESWDLLMRVNATAAFDLMRLVLPAMRERGDGLIVNVSSLSAKRPGPLGGVAYNASKYAMAGLGLTVGEEEKDRGIRVTTIYPGEVETPILEARPAPVSDERRATMLQPEDVAAAVMTVANLPPRAHVPEMVIKPTVQSYV